SSRASSSRTAQRFSRTRSRCSFSATSFRGVDVSTPPKSLSEVRYAAILAYSTLKTPATQVSLQSQAVRDALKNCRREYVERFGVRAAEAVGEVAGLSDFLGSETTLVPVPRRVPRVGS